MCVTTLKPCSLSILCCHVHRKRNWACISTKKFPFWFDYLCRMSSLAAMREALLISYSQHYWRGKLALLYDANQSKPIFPFSKFERFNIDDWDEEECWTELRCGKDDLELLLNNLQIPADIVCSQRTVCGGMEGMCILLKRLAYPCRYTEVVPRFGCNPTEICLIFNEVLDLIDNCHQHRLLNWHLNPFLQPIEL